MMRSVSFVAFLIALSGCSREPCRGYGQCPVEEPLWRTDFPCCCGDVYVDHERLAEARAREDDGGDTGDWNFEALVCTAGGAVEELGSQDD